MKVLIWETIADRAWYAYYCLPRDAKGNLPARKLLEDQLGLSNGIIEKLMNDKRKSPGVDTLDGVAQALGCDFCWLATARGEPPTPQSPWPIPVRPGSAAEKAELLRSRNLSVVTSDDRNSVLPQPLPVDDFVEMTKQERQRRSKPRVTHNADKANKNTSR